MHAHRPTYMASDYAISAGHYLAAEAGKAILDAGGNAVDAGVAAGITLGVVQSDLVNFAGVAPIMIWLQAQQRVLSIDGLGSWPAATDIERLAREGAGAIPQGVLRTVVPAAPAAWLYALEHYGTLSFADVSAAAIRLARDGFAIDPFMCEFIESHADGFGRWPSNAAIYLPGGTLPRPGQRFVQRDLAASLSYMADEERAHAHAGRSAGIAAARAAFYSGDIASRIVSFMREQGGWVSAADMADYQVRLEPTVSTRFREHEVHCCGPWSQGPALAQTLALLEGFDLAALEHNSVDYLHTVAECLKLAFADRERHYTDPALGDVPIDALLAAPYSAARRALLDQAVAWPGLPPAGAPPAAMAPDAERSAATRESRAGLSGTDPHDTHPALGRMPGDTSYVCVVDREGNAFSATPSDTACESPVVPGTGLCPSSRGSQSRPDAAHPAAAAPGKRPRLTPNPAIALKAGRAALVFGTPGGDVQVQAMTQLLLNRLVFNMDLQQAVEAPRIASFSFPSSFSPFDEHPGVLGAEARIDADVLRDLAARGHHIEQWPGWTRRAGALCAIEVDCAQGTLHAAADPRRAAYAMGR